MAVYGKRYHESLKEFNKKEQFEHIHKVFDSICQDNLESEISLDEIIRETRNHVSEKVARILEISDKEREILSEWLNDKKFLVNLKYLIRIHSAGIFETRYKVGEGIEPQLYKIGVRFDYESPLKKDAVCIVVVCNKTGKYKLVTAWLNKKDDKHKTLNPDNYCSQKLCVSCEDCKFRRKSSKCFEYVEL